VQGYFTYQEYKGSQREEVLRTKQEVWFSFLSFFSKVRGAMFLCVAGSNAAVDSSADDLLLWTDHKIFIGNHGGHRGGDYNNHVFGAGR
jgi:hypothetical protein